MLQQGVYPITYANPPETIVTSATLVGGRRRSYDAPNLRRSTDRDGFAGTLFGEAREQA